MKTIIVLFFIFVMFDCSKKDNIIQDQSEAMEYVPGEIIVGFVDTVSQEQAENLFRDLNITSYEIDCFDFIKCAFVKVPVGEEHKWIIEFKKYPEIKYAKLNQILKPR